MLPASQRPARYSLAATISRLPTAHAGSAGSLPPSGLRTVPNVRPKQHRA